MAKTIGQLTQATTLAGADEFIIEQSGLTKRVAASVVRGGLVNADIDAAAAIAFSKLAALDDANLLVGNGSNVATKVAVTGDVTISNAGVTAIGISKVVTAMITDANVTTAKIADANVTAAKLSGAQTGSAPIYGCRAWVNFDGTRNEADTGASTNGANVKIRANGNVASVTKNDTGDYTVNFTTAMSDANYSAVSSVVAASSSNATLICAKYAGTSTSASFRVQSTSNAALSTYFDLSDISVQFFR
jgi:hypothetical protein